MRRRPSPSLAISIAALIVALAGTAIAGVATVSKLSKSEKKQVRRLADQEIDKKAPGLAVKSAGVAGDVSNQLWAVIAANGTLVRSNGHITGVAPDPPGKYEISTDRDVSSCFYIGSLGGSETDVGLRGDVAVNPSSTSNRNIYVLTSNTADPPQNENRNFTLLIRC